MTNPLRYGTKRDGWSYELRAKKIVTSWVKLTRKYEGEDVPTFPGMKTGQDQDIIFSKDTIDGPTYFSNDSKNHSSDDM
ncbi:hypothetical protein YC2023_016804 [Brassica napus]